MTSEAGMKAQEKEQPMPRPTYTKEQIIKKACAELRGALEAFLDDDATYESVCVQELDPYQSMHWRGEIEIFKPDED